VRATQIPTQPLALDLYYLVTAWAGSNYVQEQQAMSVALKAFQEHPIIRLTPAVQIDGVDVPEEFTLTMEMETPDELGRLWQAVSSPARLAAVYKASVVFITPELPEEHLAPPAEALGLAVGTTGQMARSGAYVIGGSRPLLIAVKSVYTIRGAGFVSGLTKLTVGDGAAAVELSEVSGTPSPGEFEIPDKTSIEFQMPPGLPPGEHAVHVQINGVELPPAWWVNV